MKKFISGKWLLLIHQIPPKPDAFRVKIWRRLQQVGAVAIKPSVYTMPFSDQSREDLSWIQVMIQRFQLQDKALAPLAEVVHDIDLKDAKFGRAVTDGFNALLTGLTASRPDDNQRMAEGAQLFENLYVYFHRHRES